MVRQQQNESEVALQKQETEGKLHIVGHQGSFCYALDIRLYTQPTHFLSWSQFAALAYLGSVQIQNAFLHVQSTLSSFKKKK